MNCLHWNHELHKANTIIRLTGCPKSGVETLSQAFNSRFLKYPCSYNNGYGDMKQMRYIIYTKMDWGAYLQRLEISPDAGKISVGPGIRITKKKRCVKLQYEEQPAPRATWLPICTMECFICCMKYVSSRREISGNAFFCFVFRFRVRAGVLGARGWKVFMFTKESKVHGS